MIFFLFCSVKGSKNEIFGLAGKFHYAFGGGGRKNLKIRPGNDSKPTGHLIR